MSEKVKNALLTALQGEINAVKYYTKAAEIALHEGYPNIAYLFTTLIYAEKIHVKNHQNALGEPHALSPETPNLNSTLDNVKESYANEKEEGKRLYSKFQKAIKKDLKSEYGKVANLSFEWAKETELTHAEMLKMALDYLQTNQDLQCDVLYVCDVCGNIRLSIENTVCPVCKHDASFYNAIAR